MPSAWPAAYRTSTIRISDGPSPPTTWQGLRNNKLFEVYNGHPMVNNAGGSGHPSLEQTWDALLSRGILLFGLATDDAHEFKKLDDLSSSRPGMGWVMVRAEKLEAKAIVAAIDRGDFYASTGVELAAYEASTTAITLKVKPRPWGTPAQRQHVGGLPHHVHREGRHGARRKWRAPTRPTR